uniref:Phosphoribulokinase/uridine kinase domain-containing protein n=1 Tax=Setaria italica TaxID=4555 RepID=K3ZD91_SETIT
MEEVYDTLAEHLLSVLKNIEHLDSKYIVGLAGPPGAGKSTVASEVVRRVNMLWSHAKGSGALLPTEEIAAMLPMDGFHLYRAQLDAMENPKEAHARRGGKEPDVAAWRISYNDRPNAELIMESRKDADLVIRSVDFSS